MTRIVNDYNNNNVGKIWRDYKYDLDKPVDMAKYVARIKWTFPGGYELFIITDDGGLLCNQCCKTEFDCIAHAWPGEGWMPASIGHDAELEEHTVCDHCNRVIFDPND